MADESVKRPDEEIQEAQEAPEQTAQAEEGPQEYKVNNVIEVKIGVKPGYVLRKVGEAYMVMPTGPRMKDYKGMITLNETGAVLFKAAQKPDPDFDSLMQALRDEYGVGDEEAAKAVDSFVQQCGRAGLFEVTSTPIDEYMQKQREAAEANAAEPAGEEK